MGHQSRGGNHKGAQECYHVAEWEILTEHRLAGEAMRTLETELGKLRKKVLPPIVLPKRPLEPYLEQVALWQGVFESYRYFEETNSVGVVVRDVHLRDYERNRPMVSGLDHLWLWYSKEDWDEMTQENWDKISGLFNVEIDLKISLKDTVYGVGQVIQYRRKNGSFDFGIKTFTVPELAVIHKMKRLKRDRLLSLPKEYVQIGARILECIIESLDRQELDYRGFGPDRKKAKAEILKMQSTIESVLNSRGRRVPINKTYRRALLNQFIESSSRLLLLE